MYYILLLCNCVICINCHLGLSCVNNVFCYSLPGIGGQSYVDTANNNNNKLCPSLAKFNFINVFVFDVRNMHKTHFRQFGETSNSTYDEDLFFALVYGTRHRRQSVSCITIHIPRRAKRGGISHS